ncbi:MAG: hypothetical protein HY290_33495 [Planctomycetia bacterium]|nr:hypothetical protein [Planctomycetia bacterium]
MDQLDLSNPIVLAAIAAVMFFGGQLLFKGDTAVENRRRGATRLAGRLRELGFTRLPPILEDYSVGDYSGMISKIRDVAEMLGDDKERHAEFEKVFQLILEAKMKDPEKRDGLIKAFDKLRVLYSQIVAPQPDAAAPAPPTVIVQPIHVPVPAAAAGNSAPAAPNPGLS